MKVFARLYDKILLLAAHRLAIYILALVAFFESFILLYPPPDVLLAPMVLRQKNAWYLATITTIFSVLGGIAGYLLGVYAYEWLLPWLIEMSYQDTIAQLKTWFDSYGVWIVLIAGFSPVPYKLFTIMSGVLLMNFGLFVLASILARGSRFFLVALLVKYFGHRCDAWLKRYIDRLGWLLIVILVLVYYVK